MTKTILNEKERELLEQALWYVAVNPGGWSGQYSALWHLVCGCKSIEIHS